jgi:hypothetical protein
MAAGPTTSPIDAERARSLGLKVETDPPDEVRRLMRLYPQPRNRRLSVEYLPIPYDHQGPHVESRPGGAYPAHRAGAERPGSSRIGSPRRAVGVCPSRRRPSSPREQVAGRAVQDRGSPLARDHARPTQRSETTAEQVARGGGRFHPRRDAPP